MLIGYMRVSTGEQSLDLQRECRFPLRSDPGFSLRLDPGGSYVPRCGLWVKPVIFPFLFLVRQRLS